MQPIDPQQTTEIPIEFVSDLGSDAGIASGKVYRNRGGSPPFSHNDIWVEDDDKGHPVSIKVYDYTTREWVAIGSVAGAEEE